MSSLTLRPHTHAHTHTHTHTYAHTHTPTVLFQRRRKYNVPVQMCGHPELNQYVRDVLGSVRPLLERGAVDRVVLAIEDKVQNQLSCHGNQPQFNIVKQKEVGVC